LNDPHDILKSVANKNQFAFQTFYDLFCDKVYNTALSYTKNKQQAEEIVQDVFTKIYQNADKFKGNSAVSTWVYRITINTSLNYIRKEKRFSFFALGKTQIDQSDFEHPGVLLENKENAKALFQVIDSLAENQKTAFILSYIEDLPRKEVADIMQLSLKAVESLLQRAKKNLRLKLNNLYPNRRKSKK